MSNWMATLADDSAAAVAKHKADARALWAVRVLDARKRDYGDGWDGPLGPEMSADGRWFVFAGGDHCHYGANEDAARHAAALAVFPTLPVDVRAALGECP